MDMCQVLWRRWWKLMVDLFCHLSEPPYAPFLCASPGPSGFRCRHFGATLVYYGHLPHVKAGVWTSSCHPETPRWLWSRCGDRDGLVPSSVQAAFDHPVALPLWKDWAWGLGKVVSDQIHGSREPSTIMVYQQSWLTSFAWCKVISSFRLRLQLLTSAGSSCHLWEV